MEFRWSSTNQNKEPNNTEVVLVLIRLFNDPMRGHHHKLVLCECYHNYNEATHCNERYRARQIFKKKDLEPWFGMEQEYFILNPDTNLPIGYSPTKKQGQFYCGNGSENSYGRKFAEEHLKLCMDAGVNICGINAEVSPGQWEFQVGPCEGIEIGDHMHIARYLLYKATEIFNCYITLDPKPLKVIIGMVQVVIQISTQIKCEMVQINMMDIIILKKRLKDWVKIISII